MLLVLVLPGRVFTEYWATKSARVDVEMLIDIVPLVELVVSESRKKKSTTDSSGFATVDSGAQAVVVIDPRSEVSIGQVATNPVKSVTWESRRGIPSSNITGGGTENGQIIL